MVRDWNIIRMIASEEHLQEVIRINVKVLGVK